MTTRHIIGWEKNSPCSATMSIGTTGSTVDVTVQLLDYQGNALTAKAAVNVYYSTDATGLAVEEVGAAVVVATDGICIETLTKFAALVVSEEDGGFVLTLDGDSAVDCYLNIIFPDGHIQTSAKVDFNA